MSDASLTPLDKAIDQLLEGVVALPAQRVPLASAAGRVAARAVISRAPLPRTDVSAMDGYAVRSADVATTGATSLRVVAVQAAGHPVDVVVARDECVRIMTGAAMPAGADAVVRQERVRVEPEGHVVIVGPIEAGTDIRVAGSEVSAGAVVVPAGVSFRPVHIGLAAAAGWTAVDAHRIPVVGVASTGDELVDVGGSLAAGQIYDSNRPMLLAALGRRGWPCIDLGSFGDDLHSIAAALRGAAETCDVIVTSGGVSVGDFDWMTEALADVGVARPLRIAIRPAKPFAHGWIDGPDGRRVSVACLPGNPVSAMVAAAVLLRPLLDTLSGAQHPRRRLDAVLAAEVVRKPDGRIHLVPVTITSGPVLMASPIASRGHQNMVALAHADALAEIPDGPSVPAGAIVRVHHLP